MNSIINLRKTSTQLAMEGNNVLAMGRIMNRNELAAMNNVTTMQDILKKTVKKKVLALAKTLLHE